MTLGGVRDFFRTQLNALGLKEWTAPFVIDNIPAQIFDKSYHLDVGNIQVGSAGVQGVAFNFAVPIVLKVLSKGFRNPSLALDAGLDRADDILEALLSATIDGKGLKHVHPRGVKMQPLSLNNESAIILQMDFTADLILTF